RHPMAELVIVPLRHLLVKVLHREPGIALLTKPQHAQDLFPRRKRGEGWGEGPLTERVLYRDGLILVIDEPAGIAVHPGPGGGPDLESRFDELRFGLRAQPALAHRLPPDTRAR